MPLESNANHADVITNTELLTIGDFFDVSTKLEALQFIEKLVAQAKTTDEKKEKLKWVERNVLATNTQGRRVTALELGAWNAAIAGFRKAHPELS